MTTVNTPTTSITGIVFSIRTARPLDLPTVRHAILRAGFVRSVHGMALIAHKADAALALLDYASHLSLENLTDRINVELGHRIERGMGSRLVADLEHLASDLDATICNGAGEVLTLEALNAIAAGIDATAAPAVQVKAPSRTKPAVVRITKPSGLSFHTRHLDARGNALSDNAFDVPLEDYDHGWDTGRRAAAELLAVLKTNPNNGEPAMGLRLSDLLPDVAKALAERAHGDTPAHKGAALGFLSVLDAAIKFAVHNSDMQGYVQRELDRSEAYRLREVERKAAERVEFVQRMQAARRAKRETVGVAA